MNMSTGELSVWWFSAPLAKKLWPQWQNTGPHAGYGLSLAWLMAVTACPLSAATWLWQTKRKHWWICFKWSECQMLTDTLAALTQKNNKKTVSEFALSLCSFWSSAHCRTCTAVAAAWLISQWCLGSKTRHARDSRALLQPAVQMGPLY